MQRTMASIRTSIVVCFVCIRTHMYVRSTAHFADFKERNSRVVKLSRKRYPGTSFVAHLVSGVGWLDFL